MESVVFARELQASGRSDYDYLLMFDIRYLDGKHKETLFGSTETRDFKITVRAIDVNTGEYIDRAEYIKRGYSHGNMFSAPSWRLGMRRAIVDGMIESFDHMPIGKYSVCDRTLTEEELLSLVEEVEHSGGIGEQESELIKNAMELNENDAADIATPRVDVVAIPVDASKEEISSTFAESGYSRLPVYEETVDGIIGIIHQNDFYREINNPKINIHDIMKKPIFVPQTIKIGSLLKLLQHEKCHMAVVSDEYGGTYGIVTMEDVLEELVGEIWDEHDEVEEDFTKVSDGVYTVSGSADPEETLENLGIDKEVDCATMGGWVMDELNKIPEVGDTFDCEGYTVTVTAVDGMRAETIEIKKDSEKEAAEEKQ